MSRISSLPPLFFTFAIVAAPVLATAPVRAQTSASETAKVTQLFKAGKAAFGKGDMVEAERLFSEAFALRKSSDIAANLAQSELEQQKYRSAAQHFQWALVNLLPSASDAQRRAVETGLARSRAEVAVLRLDIKPEGSDVLVGEQTLGKAPITSNVYVEPGEVIVSVKHEGFVAIDKRVVASKGTEQAVEVTLSPKEVAPEPGPRVDSGLRPEPVAVDHGPAVDAKTERKSLAPAFVATGVAVAGGITGLALTLSANSSERKADNLRDELMDGCGDTPTASASDCANLRDQRESVDTKRNVAVGAFVVGGVAALAAGYFYWDALRHRDTQSATRRSRPRFSLLPELDLRPARGRDAPLGAMKLNVSGTF